MFAIRQFNHCHLPHKQSSEHRKATEDLGDQTIPGNEIWRDIFIEAPVSALPRCLSVITVLHGMQTRSSDENSVRLSVCPSVTRVNCDKTVERSVQIYIPYERTFSLVF